jgi:hypothetical protein
MRQFNQKKFSAEQREEMCSQFVKLLVNLTQLVTNAVEGIKEKQK